MWRKTNTYVEQPAVEFTRRCTFLLANAGEQLDRYWYWSADHSTNGMGDDHSLVPVIESRQVDVNGDGKVDEVRNLVYICGVDHISRAYVSLFWTF